MTERLSSLLFRIDALREKADALGELPAEVRAALDQKIRLDWTYFSNKMEGNSLDYGETKLVLLKNLTVHGKPLADALHLKGHFIALDQIEKLAKKDTPLTESALKKVHFTIFQDPFQVSPDDDPRPGKWKNVHNYVDRDNDERYYFLPPGEPTQKALSDLLNWTNNQLAEPQKHRKKKYRRQDFDFHPLVVSAEFHRRFVEIHPFLDGNGRLARLFSNLILIKFGFPPIIVRTATLKDYYNALEISKEADLEAFSVFMAERLIEALEFFISVAEGGTVEEPEDWEKRLAILKHESKNAKAIAPPKSIELFSERWDDTFVVLINELNKKLTKFNSLFVQNWSSATLDESSKMNIDSFIDQFSRNKESYSNFYRRIDLGWTWSSLLIIQKSEKTETQVSLLFSTFHYQIHLFELKETIEKKWNEPLTEKEIKTIINKIAKKLVDEIEKMKSADAE